MKHQYRSFLLSFIIVALGIFSCDFVNPLFNENGSLAIKCTINKNQLDKTFDASSSLTIERIRCIIYKDGSVKKDFNLKKDGNKFVGSVRLKKGTYDVKLEAYDESDILSHTGSANGVEVSPLKTTDVIIILEPTEVTLTTSVNPSNAGNISKNPNKTKYDYGEAVELTASPASGYQFDHWEGDLSGSSNPANIKMNGNKSVAAVFIIPPEIVTTPNTPTGPSNGSVGQSLSFSTGGSISNLGHTVEYRFDWGDGKYSSWNSSTQSYSYGQVGAYIVHAQARCQSDTSIISDWSAGKSVTITGYTLSISVTPSGSGSVSKNPNKNEYNHNEIVQLTANQTSGFLFDHWIGDLAGNSNPANITMNGNKSVTAIFTQVGEIISTPNAPSGPSSATVGQSSSFSTGGSTTNLGHVVEYRFDWGDGNYSSWGSSTQSCVYNNVGTYQIKAQARCQTHTNIVSNWSSAMSITISGHVLSISVSPSGSGSVTKSPSKTEYNHNESVQLTATATFGYQFDHWIGDLSGISNPANIAMNGNKIVTAVFVQVVETVSAPNTPSGPSTGTVVQSLSFSTGGSKSNLGHIVEYQFDWGNGTPLTWGDSTQSHVYNIVGTYQIKAQARCQTHTNVVSNWSQSISISISGYTLNITINPTGSGSVNKNPNKTQYNHSENVQLTAISSDTTKYKFDHWEGDLGSNSNPANIAMNENKNVTAVFLAETVSTPNTPSGQSSGTVGQSLSFSTGGSTSNLGHVVEYRFDWGDGNYSSWGSSIQSYVYSNVGTYLVRAQARCKTDTNILSSWSSAKTVSISGHTMIISINPAGAGTVAKSPDKTSYNYNEIVQLTASPSSGFNFDHWEGDLSGASNPVNITMNGNKNITAVFNSDLVAYYPFHGNANDSSGNGNHGTVFGAVPATDRFGKPNEAYYFDGVNDLINCGHKSSLQLTNALTISVWFSSNVSDILGEYLIGKCDRVTPSYEYSICWDYHSGSIMGLKTCVGGENYDETGSNYVPPDTQWHHIVITFSYPGQLTMYLDGNKLDISKVTTGRIEPTLQDMVIGCIRPSGEPSMRYFSGKIDDIRIYDRVLSHLEIQELYHEGGW